MKNLIKETQTPVKARKGTCSMGGIFITETEMFGVIEKINAKSIRVKLSHIIVTRIGKAREVLGEYDTTQSVSFKYWKTVDGRELYRDDNSKAVLEF